tara:strand:+ start:25 stop:168 length:144 start_codon:yes stop_codon:yes gene_type:complete
MKKYYLEGSNREDLVVITLPAPTLVTISEIKTPCFKYFLEFRELFIK